MRKEPRIYTRATRIRSWRSDDGVSQMDKGEGEGGKRVLEEAERIFENLALRNGHAVTERALRIERRKRRACHHSYDLARHIRLVRLNRAQTQT